MASHRDRVNLCLDEETEKFLLKEFYYLLQISGVVLYTRGKWYYFSVVQYIIYISLLMISFVQLLYSTILLKDYELSVAAQTFHVAGGIAVCISILVWIPYHRELIAEVASYINVNFYDYGPSFHLKKVEPWFHEMREFKRKAFKYLLVLLALIGGQAFIGGPIQDKIQGMEMTETWINNVYMPLPMPIYLPFYVDNVLLHYALFVYEVSVALVLLLVLCSGIFIIFFYFHAINTSLRILNESVSTIEDRAASLYKNWHSSDLKPGEYYKNKLFMEAYAYCIKQNVEHHVTVMRAQGMIDRLQKWPMFLVVFFMSLVIACALFTGEKRISPQLFSLFLMLMEVMAIYVISWRGQELIDTSNEFFRSFYQTKWFQCDEKTKKSIIIIQEQTKTPLTYKVGGITNIDWELFGAVMNTAYTYFNLIYAMKDNHAQVQ